MSLTEIKIIGLSSVGGALEFFEFTIYALFAQYIGVNFFPNTNSTTMLMTTFGVYALGYLARPFGGILFGHLGDRYGRKNAFTLTILLMAVATLLIGCLPTYQSIGISAPLILICLRLVQGFSVGGEIAGATIFTAEHLPMQKRGLGIGIVFMGITLGNTLGGIVGFILNYYLGDAAMVAWGWRLPFLIGFILGIFSYLIRRNTLETPIFQEMEAKKTLEPIPLIKLFKTFRQPILIGMILMAISSTMISFFLYLPVYLSNFLHFKMTQSFLLNVTSFLILATLTAIFGALSDYINRRILAIIGCFIMAIIGYIGFNFFLVPKTIDIFIFVCLLAIGASFINGCYALLIAELFPPNVRYSGMALSYSAGVALFGGFGPLAFTFLTKTFNSIQAPYYYLLFCILITLFALFFYKNSTNKIIELTDNCAMPAYAEKFLLNKHS